MLRDDRRRVALSCRDERALACLGSACPGRADPLVCRHLAILGARRSKSSDEQASDFWDDEFGFVSSTEPARGRLRVGLWSPCLGQGGAEAWQLCLAKAVDPESVAWSGAVVIEGRSASDPVMLEQLSRFMPVGFGLEAARTLASFCDVIISWAVIDVARVLAELPQPPEVVMACHFPSEAPWGIGTISLLSGVSRYVAVSELALESIPPSLRGRVEVIWNAVDERRLAVVRDRREVRSHWGCPVDAPLAGYLGRLAPEKDPDAMLRLACKLPEPWHVVVVGEGRERDALTRRMEAEGLNRVHLVGGDPSAGDVLNAFDALVVPSFYESFGLTLAEGFWSGLPVVSTRSGLAKLVPGLVREVPVRATGLELASALLADHHDPAGTRRRVARARAFARDHLGLDRFGRAWTEFLTRSPVTERSGDSCRSTSRSA